MEIVLTKIIYLAYIQKLHLLNHNSQSKLKGKPEWEISNSRGEDHKKNKIFIREDAQAGRTDA